MAPGDIDPSTSKPSTGASPVADALRLQRLQRDLAKAFADVGGAAREVARLRDVVAERDTTIRRLREQKAAHVCRPTESSARTTPAHHAKEPTN
jgi:hypothetical protein